VDLGAESGRVVRGDLDGGHLSIEVVHRFENQPARLPDGLRWNVFGLFSEVLAGLHRVGEVTSIGVDAWGCDYALLDEAGRMVRIPFHYRDPRVAPVPARAFAAVSRDELYRRTGIQHLRINTVFQLLADAEERLPLDAADRIALIPDLINYWLTGVVVNEATVASTTGLVDAQTRTWARDLVKMLGLPEAPFRHDPVDPGVPVGHVAAHHGLTRSPLVRTVAAHDTASAFVAAPLASASEAVISCGTWSLVGLEVDKPCLSPDAAAANVSNEWGIEGTTRLLRNVMGLWLLQECRRQWERQGTSVDYDDLELLAAGVSDDVPLFNPDLELFLQPGDIPARVGAVCRETGQDVPRTEAELVRSILLSLVCKYKLVLEELERVTGRDVDVVHVVGGGARNELLCQLAADVIGAPVLAGPAEASAIGNILVQARAAGAFNSLEEMRICVSRSFPCAVYEPTGQSFVYERFLSVLETGDRIGVRS
jgi:rhamnulokinase